jgi:hypothetical protein
MVNKDNKRKSSILSKVDPQSILLYLMYVIGWIYHGTKSSLEWLINKLKQKK